MCQLYRKSAFFESFYEAPGNHKFHIRTYKQAVGCVEGDAGWVLVDSKNKTVLSYPSVTSRVDNYNMHFW